MRPTSSSTLRSVLRTTAPRRLASTSSSAATAATAAAAAEGSAAASSTVQKKAQDALGTASAAAARAGTYARSALGPLGSRLSGLLGCPSSLPFQQQQQLITLFFPAYQQPVKYNLSVAREVLKYVYAAERLQPPTSLGAVLGTYSTLWARARSVGYWREVVRSGEYARLGVYALEAYGIFKVCFLLLPFLEISCISIVTFFYFVDWRDCGS